MTHIPDLELPKQVAEVLNKLYEHSYNAYVYGECVRELLRGQTPFEYSVLTDCEGQRIAAIFDNCGYKLEVNEAEGEVVVTVLGIAVSIGSYHESELKTELEMRCAFTFNAIAFSAKRGSGEGGYGFTDYWNGLEAMFGKSPTEPLEKPEIVFLEENATFNPHDILPALELYARGDFVISDSANALILLNYTKAVAVREEIEEILMGKNVRDVLSEYCDIFTALIPELKMLEREGIADTDLLGQSFRRMGLSSPSLTLRYALLFYELGKPDCHSCDADGVSHYYGHLERSQIYTRRIMTRLGCRTGDISEVCDIIENAHMAAAAEMSNLADLRDRYGGLGLKQLLQFNVAVGRADFDEKAAMNYKKLIGFV
ncbi:MAG: hypothetical protein FWD35_04380 [Oscillospiraceae bacterium]|nr:hypothetical protein [Oscillospiraceae bacterium]